MLKRELSLDVMNPSQWTQKVWEEQCKTLIVGESQSGKTQLCYEFLKDMPQPDRKVLTVRACQKDMCYSEDAQAFTTSDIYKVLNILNNQPSTNPTLVIIDCNSIEDIVRQQVLRRKFSKTSFVVTLNVPSNSADTQTKTKFRLLWEKVVEVFDNIVSTVLPRWFVGKFVFSLSPFPDWMHSRDWMHLFRRVRDNFTIFCWWWEPGDLCILDSPWRFTTPWFVTKRDEEWYCSFLTCYEFSPCQLHE